MKRTILVCACLLLLAAFCAAQKNKGIPLLNESAVVRHYWLLKNGGVIEISPKDANDSATMDLIQKHCEALVGNLGDGDFDATLPPGVAPPPSVAQLRKLRNQINFQAAPTDTGWSVRMLTIDPAATQAIQDFLRFQIAQRKTGDPTTAE